MWFMQNAHGEARQCRRRRHDYLHLFGLVALGLMWAQMAKAAHDEDQGGRRRAERSDGQARHGALFIERVLPETAPHLARISAGADGVMALPAEAF